MNEKKYISAVILGLAIVIGAGVAYYFDPAAINGVLGIGSTQIDAISDADLPAMDDGLSSSTNLNYEINADGTSSPASSVEKSAQEKDGAAASGAADAQIDAPRAATSPADAISGDADHGAVISSGTDATVAAASCLFPAAAPSTTAEIILNEIAWMGSPSSSDAEWMELKNISTDIVDLSGWELMNASGKIKISFAEGDTIAPGGFLLLVRGNADVEADGVSAIVPKTYSGSLVNTGDVLALMDPQCGVSDYLDASNGWPGGNNVTKATLERDADGIGWHTSALAGGTPGAENSSGPPPAEYQLSVVFEGDASGAAIASDPAGLVCGVSCMGNFASGTKITLTPETGTSGGFEGWSGSCYGETICSFTIAATTSLVAEFQAAPPVTASNSDADVNGEGDNSIASIAPAAAASSSDDGSGDIAAPAGTAAGHVLIAAVQIAGAASSNDFVRLYNPTAAAVDMSGWKLHKRSNTGADYSLKEFPAESVIAAGQSFIWANSVGGFSEAVGANVSSTETLAADNSVALMDGAGNVIDAVAWGTGTGQYGEGPPYPTDPGPGQTLARRSSGGVMVDTDNNTNDFIIQ